LEFFWSMSDVGWASLLTDITTLEIRGKTVGALNFIASLGRMVGIIFAGFLYNDGAGFQNGTIFFIVTALLLTGAAIMTFTSRHIGIRTSQPKQPTQETETRIDRPPQESGRAYWWFLACLIVIVLGTASVNQIFLLYISLPSGLNAGEHEMSLILTAWTIGGMFASLAAGGLVDRIGRMKVIFAALGLAIVTPLLYGLASDVPTMALVYGVNGVAFWSFQTGTFALAGDMIQEQRRGRLFGRFNAAIALSWGPAGILIGGPLADLQYKVFGVPLHVAFLNAFYVSSIIVALGTIFFAFFAVRVARKESLTRTVQVLNHAEQKS
jgi:MFS family permease